MSPELIDGLRDLCVAVAILAHRTAALIGTDNAAEVLTLAGRLSETLDAIEADQ